jgi:pimeloyl-ACP methyl ester carboxylesterase
MPWWLIFLFLFWLMGYLKRRAQFARWIRASSEVHVGCPSVPTPSGMLDGVRVCVLQFDGTGTTDLLLVHGAVSEGKSWFPLCADPRLRSMYRCIHVVDVPGYGASHVSSIPSTSADVQHAFARVLGCVIRRVTADRPVVVMAHSMGVVLTSSLVDDPRVRALVWVCPVGALPTLGTWGAWWSLLFQTGFPHRQLHALGPAIGGFLTTLFGCGAEYDSLCKANATGYRAPQRFVGRSSHGRHFSDPWIYKVARKMQLMYMSGRELPRIAFVSGGEDSLVPPHIADMAHRTLASYCPTYEGKRLVVPTAGHSLSAYDNDTLLRALRWSMRPAQGNGLRAEGLSPITPTPTDFPEVGYASSFSPARTHKVISQLYDELVAEQERCAIENGGVSGPDAELLVLSKLAWRGDDLPDDQRQPEDVHRPGR